MYKRENKNYVMTQFSYHDIIESRLRALELCVFVRESACVCMSDQGGMDHTHTQRKK